MKLSLKEFQQYCLNQKVAFVSYSLPGKNAPVTLFLPESEVKEYNRISDVEESNGFLLSPFQSENFPVIVFHDRNKAEGWEVNIRELPEPSSNRDAEPWNLEQYVLEFNQYVDQIEEIKRSIGLGEAQKVVLSRTKVWQGVDINRLPDIFEELSHNYKSAFVYLFYTSKSGLWLGATPETLIEINHSTFSTMALAGTKEFYEDVKDIIWTEKELKEHAYVADYVRQKLLTGGYLFDESEKETVPAGNVVHLRTLFKGKVNKGKTDWKQLVDLLYPTPAICGTESEATLQLIRKIEKHKREYYAGIIGPFNEGNETALFVNLRCMKIVGDSAVLYAGGGILSESSAPKEWEETEMKFNTLIQVIIDVENKINMN